MVERPVSADSLLPVLERLSRVPADLVGVTIGVRVLAPERVFIAAEPEPAFLWSGSPGVCEVGFGVLHRFTNCSDGNWSELAYEANNLCRSFQGLGIGACSVEPRFYGGASFVPGGTRNETWSAFADHEFVLPRMLYRLDSSRGRASLTLFALRGDLEDPAKRQALAGALCRSAQLGGEGRSPGNSAIWVIQSREQNPGYETWAQQVLRATELLQDGRLEKVVLARELVLRCSSAPDVAAILGRLLNRNDGSVCFAFRSGAATFLGATPERLVSRHGPLIRTEALAGSAAADDPAAVQTLLDGDKDRREHAFVVNEIVARLKSIGARLSVPARPALWQFGPVVHLRTLLETSQFDAPHVLALAHLLHPTPAVGGIPLPAALGFIRAHESFERGRYASPAGWFDCHGDGELVVALRSGLVRGHEVHLFAGAGIVKGSEAAAEWSETELKFRTLLDALGVYPGLGSSSASHES